MNEIKQICEYTTAEKPVIEYLKDLGWNYLNKEEVSRLREGNEKNIIFESVLKSVLKKLNGFNSEQLEQVLREFSKIKDGEELQKWLRNEQSIKLKGNKTSTTIKLIEYDPKKIENNVFQFTNQFTVQGNFVNQRYDLLLFLNGLPLVIIEAKSPDIGYRDGINQLLRYEREMPEAFKYNQFNVALDGNNFKYGSTKSTEQYFFEWNYLPKGYNVDERYNLKRAIFGLLNKNTVLDIIENFIVYSKESNKTIKKICRCQQYEATNLIYNRVLEKKYKSGLIWHTQGSGKTMTMLFTAWKLKREKTLDNPTILLISDRIDLGDQTQGVFESASFPFIEKVSKIDELKELIDNDSRKILVSTIQKFDARKLKTTKSDKNNIIILIDEGHRSQEGDFGSVLRAVFKNAYLFSFTGTPVEKGNKSTFNTFCPIENNKLVEKYLHKYSSEDGLRDKVILPVRYNYRYNEVMITKSELDAGYFESTESMNDEQKEKFEKEMLKPENVKVLRKRITKVVKDIDEHFKNYIEPNGFKAQIVAPNRAACVIYKEELDKIRPKEESEVVMSVMHNEDYLKQYKLSRSDIKQIVNKFKKEDTNPKFLIVTDMLLTGFDAPIEKVMYLDKKIKDHTLLQALARTNRPYKNKGYGLIVDYAGILKRLQDALNFDEKDIKDTIEPIDNLKDDFDKMMEQILFYFKEFNKSSNEYFADCFNAVKYLKDDKKARLYEQITELKTIYETLSPDPFLIQNNRNENYKFIIKLYLSLMKEENTESFSLSEIGEKTRQLLEQNVHFGAVRTNSRYYELNQIRTSNIREESGHYVVDQKEVKYTKIEKIDEFIKEMSSDLIIKSIADRLETKLKEEMNKNKLTEEELLKLKENLKEFKELEEIEKIKEENNLSNRALLLFNLLNNELDEPKDFLLSLARAFDSYLEKTLFSGWSKKESLERDLALSFLRIIRTESKDLDLNKINSLVEKIIIALRNYDKHETSYS